MFHDAVQKSIVADARRARTRGFNHRGMAGDITEKILIQALEEAVPGISFDKGVVTTGGRAEYDKDDMSNQCDVIVHAGIPWEQIFEYVVVPDSETQAVIEVKYWLSPSDFDSKNVNEQVNRLRSQSNSPVFLVGFRHSGEAEDIKEKSEADETILLASGDSYTPTEEILYPGAFEKLIMEIKQAAQVSTNGSELLGTSLPLP